MKNIASILSRNIFCRFGMPEQIHSDQGPNFVSKLLKHVYESLEIQPSTTPAYNPKSNPVERSHKDLGRMLRVLSHETQDDWEAVLPTALYALRTAVNRSQLSPFRILFGREARSAIGLITTTPMRRKTPVISEGLLRNGQPSIAPASNQPTDTCDSSYNWQLDGPGYGTTIS